MILTPQILISAYSQGFFPMAESKDSAEIYWHRPDPRAIFPLYDIKIPKSVRQLFNKRLYTFTVDKDFATVIKKCGDRKKTWINGDIIDAYTGLHKMGNAHSVEAFREGNLVGGLYGVHIGGGFFGESMFGTEPNVAKLCLYILMTILIKNNFILLDSQYGNYFTYSLGAIDISSDEYFKLLTAALNLDCEFKM